MNDQPPDKISDAVETCLGLLAGKADPFTRMAAYLESLREDSGWTDADIVHVQARIIRALLKRIESGEWDTPQCSDS